MLLVCSSMFRAVAVLWLLANAAIAQDTACGITRTFARYQVLRSGDAPSLPGGGGTADRC